jgi:hypothetical protein
MSSFLFLFYLDSGGLTLTSMIQRLISKLPKLESLKDKISKIPLVRRVGGPLFETCYIVVNSHETYQAALLCVAPGVPLGMRCTSIVKVSCCSAALVTRYLSAVAPDPQLRHTFNVCCSIATAMSTYLGDSKGINSFGNGNKLVPPYQPLE